MIYYSHTKEDKQIEKVLAVLDDIFVESLGEKIKENSEYELLRIFTWMQQLLSSFLKVMSS
jgi:hypothetical protein